LKLDEIASCAIGKQRKTRQLKIIATRDDFNVEAKGEIDA